MLQPTLPSPNCLQKHSGFISVDVGKHESVASQTSVNDALEHISKPNIKLFIYTNAPVGYVPDEAIYVITFQDPSQGDKSIYYICDKSIYDDIGITFGVEQNIIEVTGYFENRSKMDQAIQQDYIRIAVNTSPATQSTVKHAAWSTLGTILNNPSQSLKLNNFIFGVNQPIGNFKSAEIMWSMATALAIISSLTEHRIKYGCFPDIFQCTKVVINEAAQNGVTFLVYIPAKIAIDRMNNGTPNWFAENQDWSAPLVMVGIGAVLSGLMSLLKYYSTPYFYDKLSKALRNSCLKMELPPYNKTLRWEDLWTYVPSDACVLGFLGITMYTIADWSIGTQIGLSLASIIAAIIARLLAVDLSPDIASKLSWLCNRLGCCRREHHNNYQSFGEMA